AVNDQRALLDLRADGGQAGELPSIVGQAVVDLVGDHIDVLLHAHFGNGLQLLAAVHHSGGVGGVVEDHALGLGGNGSGELLRGDLEVFGFGGVDHHGHAAHHADQLQIAHPVGSGQDDLV